jgi:hypothetical protein
MPAQKQIYLPPQCEMFEFLPECIIASSDPNLGNPGDYGFGGDPLTII